MNTLYCCECKQHIIPVLITGSIAYPHRQDLKDLPFLQCDICKNFIGCHPKTTNALGCIANKPIKCIRHKLHILLDQLWLSGMHTRTSVYKKLSNTLGYEFHIADIRTTKEAKKVIKIIHSLYELKVKPIEGDFV